jgi:hypothetical protein
MSLTLTQPRRLCLLRVLLGSTATVTSLPFCKHIGGATPAFSGRLVYLQFTWEMPLPHSPVEPSSWHCYKLSRSKVARQGPPLLPPQASLFIYSSVRDCPFPPLQHSGCPTLFAMCLLLLLLFIQFGFFSLFSLSGVSLSRGLCWSGPGLFVGVPCAA